MQHVCQCHAYQSQAMHVVGGGSARAHGTMLHSTASNRFLTLALYSIQLKPPSIQEVER
eukprot:m.279144 g.279144  ORF g.279144 m.279144 type:complete len:59 (+) comp19798_c0_seq4:1689-1865(+)